MSLIIPIKYIFEVLFHSTYKAIDAITIQSHTSLRKIFTLRSPPIAFSLHPTSTEHHDDEKDQMIVERIPKTLDFASGVEHTNILVDINQLMSHQLSSHEQHADHKTTTTTTTTTAAAAAAATATGNITTNSCHTNSNGNSKAQPQTARVFLRKQPPPTSASTVDNSDTSNITTALRPTTVKVTGSIDPSSKASTSNNQHDDSDHKDQDVEGKVHASMQRTSTAPAHVHYPSSSASSSSSSSSSSAAAAASTSSLSASSTTSALANSSPNRPNLPSRIPIPVRPKGSPMTGHVRFASPVRNDQSNNKSESANQRDIKPRKKLNYHDSAKASSTTSSSNTKRTMANSKSTSLTQINSSSLHNSVVLSDAEESAVALTAPTSLTSSSTYSPPSSHPASARSHPIGPLYSESINQPHQQAQPIEIEVEVEVDEDVEIEEEEQLRNNIYHQQQQQQQQQSSSHVLDADSGSEIEDASLFIEEDEAWHALDSAPNDNEQSSNSSFFDSPNQTLENNINTVSKSSKLPHKNHYEKTHHHANTTEHFPLPPNLNEDEHELTSQSSSHLSFSGSLSPIITTSSSSASSSSSTAHSTLNTSSPTTLSSNGKFVTRHAPAAREGSLRVKTSPPVSPNTATTFTNNQAANNSNSSKMMMHKQPRVSSGSFKRKETSKVSSPATKEKGKVTTTSNSTKKKSSQTQSIVEPPIEAVATEEANAIWGPIIHKKKLSATMSLGKSTATPSKSTNPQQQQQQQQQQSNHHVEMKSTKSPSKKPQLNDHTLAQKPLENDKKLSKIKKTPSATSVGHDKEVKRASTRNASVVAHKQASMDELEQQMLLTTLSPERISAKHVHLSTTGSTPSHPLNDSQAEIERVEIGAGAEVEVERYEDDDLNMTEEEHQLEQEQMLALQRELELDEDSTTGSEKVSSNNPARSSSRASLKYKSTNAAVATVSQPMLSRGHSSTDGETISPPAAISSSFNFAPTTTHATAAAQTNSFNQPSSSHPSFGLSTHHEMNHSHQDGNNMNSNVQRDSAVRLFGNSSALAHFRPFTPWSN